MVGHGMSEEDAEAQAQAYMDENADAISNDAAGFVDEKFGPEAAAQLSAGADEFINEVKIEGVETDPENAPGCHTSAVSVSMVRISEKPVVSNISMTNLPT